MTRLADALQRANRQNQMATAAAATAVATPDSEPAPEAMDKGQGSGFGQGGVVLLAVHSAGVPLNTPVNLCRFPALSPT